VQQDCGVYGIFPATTPLKWNATLAKAALEHSQDIATYLTNPISQTEAINRYKHEGSGTASDITAQKTNLSTGSTIEQRLQYHKYNYLSAGENMTAGQDVTTATQAIQRWLKSDIHCKVLMQSKFTEVGMAQVIDANSFYLNYWTQDFGTAQ